MMESWAPLDAYGAGARTWLWRDFGNCAGIKT
jgi:hypothetical protein